MAEEAEHLPDDLPRLVVGVGKVSAATWTVRACLELRPSLVVNLGTAGALHAGMAGTHEVGRVRQHDLDSVALERLTGRRYGEDIELGVAGPLLVTGDRFVARADDRDRLAASGADLVDMEAYAVVAACRTTATPVRVVKHVSDSADESAPRDWPSAVAQASHELAAWLRQQGLSRR